ncbi:MAG: MMPL family transporter [Actinobacteria bacterium]|nr:MMPL family transporter [Actinomycetota bacterium]
MRSRQKLGLAGRAGRWSAAHRKLAIWGWIAFVVAAIALGGALGTVTLGNSSGNGESASAEKTLEGAFPQGAAESVLIQAEGHESVHAPQARAAIAEVESRLRKLPFVRGLTGPFGHGAEGQVAADGRSALVKFEIPETKKIEPKEVVGKALDQVAAVQKRHPGLRVEEVGDASGAKAVSESLEEDFSKAEMTSLPITLLILVVVFGSLLAAGVPLLLALTAVGATIGIIAPVSHIFGPVAEQIDSVVLLIGLAVGVDYSMFYLRREREERAAGAGERASLEAAAATSGRAILVSGFTVMVAMAGMYIAGDQTFASFATGTIIVVAVAMVGSLTVLPAVLAWLGDRIEKGRVPFLGRRLRGGGPPGVTRRNNSGEVPAGHPRRAADGGRVEGSRVWGALVDRVMRKPWVAAGVAVVGLVVLAIPAFGLHTANAGVAGLPKDMPIVKTFDRVEAAFPGGVEPALVAISAPDVQAAPVVRQVDALRARLAADAQSFGPTQSYRAAKGGQVAELRVPLAGNGTDARSQDALRKLRDELIPATIGTVPGAKAQVGGPTASSVDFNDLLSQRMPWVFAFVLGMAFLLLLVSFRSIVIPITAICLSLLSVGAAYGIVVWVFQDGHLENLIGFNSIGSITSWLPLFLFVVLFGLSMDYHVFILTRIREAYDRGMSTEAAVSHGLRTTAGVVTSAAAVMVAVFAIFATLSFLEFKEMGVGLAAAILIDATVIRGVLLPATMKLLGERNWYLPRWLEWLPRVGLEGPAGAEPVAAPDDRAAEAASASNGRGRVRPTRRAADGEARV